MKQGTGVSASLGAIFSAIATFGCCLPLGFLAAVGAGTASAFFARYRPWLMGLSIVLMGLGFWQQYRPKQCDVRGRKLGRILLWTSVAVIVAMIVFPEQIAALLADYFHGSGQ